MEIGAILSTAINIIITAAIGIISYFVKRTIDRQDKCVTRSELESHIDMIKECKGDIKSLNDRYATKAEVEEIKHTIDKIDSAIDELKDTAVKNSEFIRVMTRLETKIDNLADKDRMGN